MSTNIVHTLLTCALCGRQYEAPAHVAGSYGLCPDHWSRDTLREYDRLQSARRHVLEGAPATLTLAEWLAIIAKWRGLCALCQIATFSELAIWIPARGLAANNVAPLCRVCAHHKKHSFLSAMERVELALDNMYISTV
jgi:hypothetical protein